MPSIGDIRDAGVVGIDNTGSTEIMANGNGPVNKKIMEINNIPENKITLEQFLSNLANSGNEKHVKLASDLLDLDMIQENVSNNLGPDCFDKISASGNNKQGNDQELGNDNENNSESDMEWTTVRHKTKRGRSSPDDSEKINLELTVSPSKKHKVDNKKSNEGQGQSQSGQIRRKTRKTQVNSDNVERTPLNKDSVLVIISDIPDNTYFNSIKMENMVLAAFPRLRESGMWTKYRVNKRHKSKCDITLPKDHHKDNVTDIIKSQSGFQKCKVDIKLGINDVPSKAYKVVAIGVHQSISDEEIIQELGKSNVKVNKVQRLKFKGSPTQKVVVEFDQEQDMKIALFNGIFFGRIRIRCEPFRPAPSITQCYQCQGFNHIAKDCKSQVKCMRCAKPHKSSECPGKGKDSFKPKCTNCNGEHIAASRECPKYIEQFQKQTEKAKARQEKVQNSLVVRGITFSNIVKNNSEKVESALTEKIQTNQRETEQVLENVTQKLEDKITKSFRELSEKVVTFMVNSMMAKYDTLDKKNADKVYDIMSKESVECFNLRLGITPPLSPTPSVETSATPAVGKASSQQNKPKKNSNLATKNTTKQRQVPSIQKYTAPHIKSHYHGIKK